MGKVLSPREILHVKHPFVASTALVFSWHPSREAQWCVTLSLDLRYVYLDLFGIHNIAITILPACPLKFIALLRKKRGMAISLFFNSIVKISPI